MVPSNRDIWRATLLILAATSGCARTWTLQPSSEQAVVRAEDGAVTIDAVDGWTMGPTVYELSGPAGQRKISFAYAPFSLGLLPACSPPPYSATAQLDLQPAHIYEIRPMGDPSDLSVRFGIFDVASGAKIWEGQAYRGPCF